jgi:hypothetical protein
MRRVLFLAIALFGLLEKANALNIDAFMDKHIAPISDKIADIIFYPINCFGSKVPIIIFSH